MARILPQNGRLANRGEVPPLRRRNGAALDRPLPAGAARIVGTTPCGCPSRISPAGVVRERPAPADANSSPNGRFSNCGAAPGRGRPYEITPPHPRPSFAAKAGIRGFDSWRNPIGGRSSDGRFTNRPYETITPAFRPAAVFRFPSCVPARLAYNARLIYMDFHPQGVWEDGTHGGRSAHGQDRFRDA